MKDLNINQVINKKKKITFYYEGKKIKASPYFIYSKSLKGKDFEHYLRAKPEGNENIRDFHLRKIKKIEILEEEIIPYEKISEYNKYFNIEKFLRNLENFF